MMAEQPGYSGLASQQAQLVQIRVPLEQASEVFAGKDASGRTPIVIIPERPFRTRNELIVMGLLIAAGGILVSFLLEGGLLVLVAIAIGVVLVVLGLVPAFWVVVPEGLSALLTRGGKHRGVLGSGSHFVPPVIRVSHLVTGYEIPYDAPVIEALTSDSVRASVDTLLTFQITDPYHFVYSMTADDFDQVLQAACQDALRLLVRQVPSDRVADLSGQESEALRATLSAAMAPYGVTMNKVLITYARPPADFLLSQETRQLSIVQRQEQAERQALSQRRQEEEDALAHQRLVARANRERQEVEALIELAEARRRAAEVEAETHVARLAKLEEALRKFPLAAQYELRRGQLDVARALAGNTRAVVQIGEGDGLAGAFMLRDILREPGPTENEPKADAAPPPAGTIAPPA